MTPSSSLLQSFWFWKWEYLGWVGAKPSLLPLPWEPVSLQLSREGQVLGALTVADHGLSKDLIMSSVFSCIYFLWRFLFIHLFWTALGLCFWNWHENFSSCGWVFVSGTGMRISLVVASEGYSSLQHTGFSWWWLLLLWSPGSRLVGSVLMAHNWVALRHVGSSWTRDQTHVPCTGRQILIHCTTGEEPVFIFMVTI